MRALVVEDDHVLRDLWCEVITQAGHEATPIAGAEAARKVLLTDAFDVVLLDLCLGTDTGLSVAAIATYCNADCRVVIVTGSNLFVRGELFDMAPNIAAVLRKPVRLQDMLAVVEYESGHSASSRLQA